MKYGHDISPKELEQIERYLRHTMTAEEAAAFGERIEMDEYLKEKVNEVRLTEIGIQETVLREKLNDYHKDMKPQKAAAKRIRLFSMKPLAASLILIVGLAAWWLMQRSGNHERIYSRYYRPDPGLMTVMSAETTNYTFEKAMVEYKNGEYQRALTAWSRLLKERPGDDTLLYFTAAASQAASDYEAAIRYLKIVADDENSIFREDACWYLGLAYLQKGEKDKAIEYLGRSQHTRSRRLINELK